MRFNNIDDIIIYSQSFDYNIDIIKREGVVFTDMSICKIIIDKLNPDITDRICEPSVGKGVFIFNLFNYFIEKNYNVEDIIDFVENRLYCYDINENFINEFKNLIINYMKLIGYEKDIDLSNIMVGDFLKDDNNDYDIILGNPPYIRVQNIDKEYLEFLRLNFKSMTSGNVDIYYAFVEKSYKISKKVGFILPNSLLKNKSSYILRKLIKDRISYVYDYHNIKVWENISTYTCLLFLQEYETENIIYEINHEKIIFNKSKLNDKKWVFESNIGNNKLGDLCIKISGGLATLRDNIYIIDDSDSDDKYFYKDNFKIEKDICKKFVKATKTKDYKYSWIIYPYNKNGNSIMENEMKLKYPYCYKYLLNKKDELSKRDKGKTDKYPIWYAYGRKQGMLDNELKSKTRIILPLMFMKENGIHFIDVPQNDDVLVLSGIMIYCDDNQIDELKTIIKDHCFYKYCEYNNRTLGGKGKETWITLSVGTLKNYKY